MWHRFGLALATMVLGSGCATLFKSSRTAIAMTSTPPGAAVLINGSTVAATPATLELSNDKSHVVTFKSPGHQDATCVVDRNVGVAWIVLDVLFWPALIVDAVTGAWYNLSPETCAVGFEGSMTTMAAEAPAPLPTPNPAAGPAPPSAPVEQARIKGLGTKCAIMPLQAVGVEGNVATIIDEVLLAELQKAGFDPISPDDINSMLGFEKTKEAAGCDSVSCVAEIGGALGVDYLTTGKVASIDGSPMLTLKIMDVKTTKVLGRVNRMGSSSVKELPGLVAQAVRELVLQSHL